MRRLVEAAAALVLVAALGSAAAARNPYLEAGKKHLEAMDERAALAAFARALARSHSASEQAEIHVYRGIALFNLLKAAEGRAAFRRALKLDADVRLPKLTSPKIINEFKRIKKIVVGSKPARPKVATPAPVSKTPAVSTVRRSAATPPPSHPAPPARRAAQPSTAASATPPAPARDSGSTINWGGWISVGATVAASGLALTLGVLAKSAADRAADLDTGSAEAQSQHDRATSLALGTNILIGVAAAGAVSATLFFIFGRRSPSRAAGDSAAVAPPALSAAPLVFAGGGGIAIHGSLPALR